MPFGMKLQKVICQKSQKLLNDLLRTSTNMTKRAYFHNNYLIAIQSIWMAGNCRKSVIFV